MAQVYAEVRGSGKVIASGRGEIIIQLGLSTDGVGEGENVAPVKDDYYAAESGVTGHVNVRSIVTPNHLGPLYLHEDHFESWDAAS